MNNLQTSGQALDQFLARPGAAEMAAKGIVEIMHAANPHDLQNAAPYLGHVMELVAILSAASSPTA